MSGRVRCAVIGLGHIAKTHLQALQSCNDAFELVAVCDSMAATAADVANRYGAVAYTGLNEMLECESPELLVICTPNGWHAAHGMMAAQAGCHILMEKPLAMTGKEAQSLIQAAKDYGVQLMVMMQLRLHPAVQLLKKHIEGNRFGQIYFIQSNLFWTRPEHYYTQAPWRGTHAQDGGLFVNQAIHHLDLMQWLMGDVESVQARATRQARAIETDDTGTALLKWPGGTIGTLNATVLTYPKNMETTLTLLAEKGSVRLSLGDPAGFTHWDVEGLSRPAINTDTSLFTDYYRHVARVLHQKEPAFIPGEEGVKSLMLSLAIKQAALSGTTIGLHQVHT